MDFLCAGTENGLALVEGELCLLVYKQNALYRLFAEISDQQISAIKPREVIFCSYDTNGDDLVVITKFGLIAVFKFNKTGEKIQSKDGESFLIVQSHTMRVIYENGKILEEVHALEDQFRMKVKEQTDAVILVPFGYIFENDILIVRVQAPGHLSQFVRLEVANCRTVLKSRNWEWIVKQGILDFKVRDGRVFLLTHSCLVDFQLTERYPIPLINALPLDMVGIKTSSEYIVNIAMHRMWESGLDLGSERPLELDLEEHIKTYQPEEIMFEDTTAHIGCPWLEIAVSKGGFGLGLNVYLLASDGIYRLENTGWVQLLDANTKEPIYAEQILASKNAFYYQSGSEPWHSFGHPDPPLGDLLAVYDHVTITGREIHLRDEPL